MGRTHRAAVTLITLASLAAAGCGFTNRVAVGPSLDADGELAVMVLASGGPLLGRTRQVAVVAADGLGVGRGGTPAWFAGAGVDWVPALARGGRVERGGRRLGVRGGWWRDDARDQLGVELVGAVTEPVPWHEAFAFGIEAACGLRRAVDDTDAAPWSCRAGVTMDAARAHLAAPGTPVY